MKRLLLILLGGLLAFNLQATHHLTYFVYVKTSFQQGYWKDADRVYDRGGVFLYPYQYTDLFGTVKVDFYNKLLDRLNSHHDFYQHVALDSNVLKQEGNREFYDTLNFAVEPGLSQEQLQTLRNELVATVLAAGESNAIRLNHHDSRGTQVKTETLDYGDLDYPLFELVRIGGDTTTEAKVKEETVIDTIYRTRTDTLRASSEPATGDDGFPACWDRYVWLGIILVLGIWVFRLRKRSSA